MYIYIYINIFWLSCPLSASIFCLQSYNMPAANAVAFETAITRCDQRATSSANGATCEAWRRDVPQMLCPSVKFPFWTQLVQSSVSNFGFGPSHNLPLLVLIVEMIQDFLRW